MAISGKKIFSAFYAGERGPVNMYEHRDPYERSFADLLPYDIMVDDGIIILKDGSFMVSYEYIGEDVETVNDADKDMSVSIANKAISRLGSGYTIMHDLMRQPVYEYLDTDRTVWPSKFAEDLDEIRKKEFLTNIHYMSRYFLSIILTPENPKISFIKKILIEDNMNKEKTSLEKTLKQFKSITSDISSLLSSVLKIKKLTHQEQLSYIRYCITGDYHPLLKFDEYCYLDSVLADDFTGGFMPKIGKKRLRLLSITGFPESVSSDTFGFLNNLPVSFRWANRFIILDEQEAINTLSLLKTKWGDKKESAASILVKAFSKNGDKKKETNDKNQDADDYETDTKIAMKDARLGHVKFGHYTSTIVLYGENDAFLDKNVRAISKYFNNYGFIVKDETVHAEQAFLGSLPGNLYANIRRPIIHTENLACMLPLYSFYQGRRINPCKLYPKNSPAIMVVNSEATTPFYFNLHVQDVGMTAIFGPVGSGKSTLLDLIGSQILRYKNVRVFLFDEKYSAYVLTRTHGGTHIDIMGPSQKLSLTPFKYILNGKSEINWATNYVALLCRMNGVDIKAEKINLIDDAIQSFANEGRIPSMSLLANRIQNQEISEALKFYTAAGSMELLDGDTENLETSFLTTFETLHLMAMDEKVLNSVLLYLFHWIQNSLNGDPTFILIDEAWSKLKNEMFKEEIKKWIKIVRSLNGAVVFATQSLSDVMNSSISDVILENCPTKILLANIEAKNDISRVMYKKLGLSDGHIDIISSMTPKRDYFYMSPEGKRIMNLELDPYTLRFFNSDMKNIEKARKITGDFYERWKTIDLSREDR